MWNIVYTNMNLLGAVYEIKRCIIDSFIASCICFRHCPTSQPAQQKFRFNIQKWKQQQHDDSNSISAECENRLITSTIDIVRQFSRVSDWKKES